MTQPPAAARGGHRDRRVGLIVFGVLEILFGGLCALLVPLLLLGQVMSRQMTGAPPDWGQLLTGCGTYAFLAVALVGIGIGSIRRRRWARALSLILGWSWLLVGAIAVVAMALLIPSMASQLPSGGPPPGVFLVVMLLVTSCPMVLVPLALVLFYRSPHVKATCETADPIPGWTDACPLPVLAASLWMAFGSATIVLAMLGGLAVVPLFGTVLMGLPGVLGSIPLVLLWAYLALALYRLRPNGWWLTLMLFVVAGASATFTFSRIDLMDLYRRMGYPEQQLEVLRQMPMFTGANIAIYIGVMFVAIIGYLLWIRRFFVRPSSVTDASTDAR